MKKITIILGLLLVFQAVDIKAQETDSDPVNFIATLETVLSLNVTGGQDQTVLFDTPDQYNFGVNVVGVTTITIESIDAWDLKISAPDFTGAGTSIPIDNLGVWCEATGTHLIGTEVSCSNTDLPSSMGITTGVQTLLDNTGTNGGNGGDASDNAFNLNWTMGTMNNTMNQASMFEQLSDGTIANVGEFTTTVTLLLTSQP